jgi:hypothetical protein
MAWSHWLAYLTATQYECVSSILIVGLADLLNPATGLPLGGIGNVLKRADPLLRGSYIRRAGPCARLSADL